ncbi:MAG TPA: protein kinase [Myxococcaceae bacterium]|nr:protein kinase [Myxococcaceae bacterium]
MKKPAVFGKYLLLERLNVGGMAEVFIAKAFGVEGFERILAIKKILPTMAEDEEFIKMFIDEARISVQLNHANIVHIHELGNYDGTFFIAMEYVAGRDLRTLLERYRKRKEKMPAAQASFIASKMCEGLDYAHRKKDARGVDLGIIHRDVSPQNILCSYEGEVKIIDFGIAKAANRSQHTQAGILKGKFGYMSPEQVRGLPIDRRSDIFAVGVILYEMLTGEKLFVGESDFSTLEKVRNAEVTPPKRLNPTIPDDLERVVLKALAREAEDRYQWPSDLQEDLMRFLVSGDVIYSNKQLSGFMREAFAEDVLREQEKMERFASVEKPEHMELSGMGRKPSIPGMKKPSSREITVPPSSRSKPRSNEGLGNGGRGPTTKMPSLASSPVRGTDGSDVPLIGMDEVDEVDDELSPSGATRTEMTPLLPDPDDEGSEPKTAIDEQLSTPAVMLGDSITGSHPTAPVMDALGEEPRTATVTGNDRSAEIAAAVSAALGDSTRPRTVSGKGPVVIGKSNGYRGATMVGPLPDGVQDEGPSARTGEEDDPGGPPRLDPEPPSLSTDPGVTMPPSEDQMVQLERRGKSRKSPPKPRLKAPRDEGGEDPSFDEDAPPRRSRVPLLLALLVLAGAGVGYAVFNKQHGAKAGSGGVLVEATPESAVLSLSGKAIPNAEVSYAPPGEYDLKATAPGFESDTRKVKVEGEVVIVRIHLKQAAGQAAPPGPGTGTPPPATGTPGTPGTPTTGTPPGATATPRPPETAIKTATPAPPPTFNATFTSTPSGAEIRLDGKLIGSTPKAKATKLKGDQTYKYTAKLAGFRTYEGTLKGDGQPEATVDIQMERDPKEAQRDREKEKEREREQREREKERERAKQAAKDAAKKRGMLACSSNPAGADVIVDSKFTGRQTPIPIAKPLELPVGPHKVVFRLGGKSSEIKSVEIKADEVVTLRNIPVE